jgi:hypothetical protein
LKTKLEKASKQKQNESKADIIKAGIATSWMKVEIHKPMVMPQQMLFQFQHLYRTEYYCKHLSNLQRTQCAACGACT